VKLVLVVGNFQRKSVGKSAATITPARVDLDGGINCLVVNMSDTKATIEGELPFNLPIEFRIAIEGEDRKRHCAIAWRKNRRVGVFFD
jgi:hypothetical protein